jgi:membrane protein DedA with SNARE-associated domain
MAGFGIALAGVAALSWVGVVPLSIDFFGFSLDDRADQIAWIGAWSLVAVLGLAVLVATRRTPTPSRRDVQPTGEGNGRP